jgi:formylglycine-generating enzyme required for sulfatase activity/DNA-binding SARP family transcriptional activator
MDRELSPKYQLSLLGRFELTGPGGPIDLGSKKLAALLALLASSPLEPHRRDKLMNLLWGSHSEAQARQNLRQALTRLRRVLGRDVIVGNGEMVSLRIGVITSDVAEFDTLVRDGSRDALRAATALYGDSFLADIAIPEEAWTEWLDMQRRRCEALALDAMVKLAEQELLVGDHEAALRAANGAIAISNLREDAHRLVLRALAANGRRADALKHYEYLAALLMRELGVQPDPTTSALAATLRRWQPNDPTIETPGIGLALPERSVVELGRRTPAEAVELAGAPATSLRHRTSSPNWWLSALRVSQVRELRLWGAVALFLIVLVGAYSIDRSPPPVSGSTHAKSAATAAVPTEPRPIFRDCEVCPEMVALPAGEFMMGSPENDDLRTQVEGPPRRVAIAKPFAIGKFEITVEQFEAFVAETGTEITKPYNHCRVVIGFDLDPPYLTGSPEASFRRPGFDVTGAHPAGCISWYDAQAYVAWLRRRTGKPYRLPTEVEWEYAARAGTTTRYSFGNDERLLCDHARFADLASRYARRDGCRSEITVDGPVQVGSLKPNAWGISDMHGNVSEWVEDCWTPNLSELPTDGSAFARPANCEMGVIRGGSWLANSRWVRTTVRWARRTPAQFQYIGFRVVLTLDPS